VPLNLGALTGLASRAKRLPDVRVTACLAPAAQPTIPASVSRRLYFFTAKVLNGVRQNLGRLTSLDNTVTHDELTDEPIRR